MIIISASHAKLLVIRVELNHEMEDVQSILLAWFLDLDAGEEEWNQFVEELRKRKG